jgi:hypothetical protein
MEIKTKLSAYVCFSTDYREGTPNADNSEGLVDIPVVILDGSFTLDDLEKIKAGFIKHHGG